MKSSKKKHFFANSLRLNHFFANLFYTEKIWSAVSFCQNNKVKGQNCKLVAFQVNFS